MCGNWRKAVVSFECACLVLVTSYDCFCSVLLLVAPFGAMLARRSACLISTIVLMTKFLSLSEGGGASDDGFLLR